MCSIEILKKRLILGLSHFVDFNTFFPFQKLERVRGKKRGFTMLEVIPKEKNATKEKQGRQPAALILVQRLLHYYRVTAGMVLPFTINL